MARTARVEAKVQPPAQQGPTGLDELVSVRRLPYLPGQGPKWFARFLITARSYARELGACVPRYSPKDVLFGLRYGFAADRVFLYGRENVRSGNYLSDLQRQFSRFINSKPARELLEDKLLFERLANRFVRVPKNYLYCDNGRLVVLCDEWTKIAANESGSEPKCFIMKRSRGGGGIKIQLVEFGGGVVSVDGASMALDQFYDVFSSHDGNILCEFIRQSDLCSRIYPHTTNSVRVICMRDRDGEPFIARAILRLGTAQSKGVDNFGRGGLSVNIDLETGMLGTAVQHDATHPREPLRYDHHPDTGAPLRGQTLPQWGVAIDQSLALMRQLPFINYVGWDIVLTEQGPVFLEGNNYTGVRLAQAHSSLLDDTRIYEFYRRFGIV